jgi:hypothetical protein
MLANVPQLLLQDPGTSEVQLTASGFVGGGASGHCPPDVGVFAWHLVVLFGNQKHPPMEVQVDQA